MKKIFLLALLLFSLIALSGCEMQNDNVEEKEKIQEENKEQKENKEDKENSAVDKEKVDSTEENTDSQGPIILPDADENTVELTVEYPQEFIQKEYDIYTIPELVDNEDFEWGEYALFGRSEYGGVVNATLMTSVPHYYILSSDTKTVSEGEALYEKLNNKYLLEYTGERTALNYENDLSEEYLDYLYKSRIVYISPDLDILERIYFLAKDTYWRFEQWNTLCSLFKNGDIIEEKEIRKDTNSYGTTYYDLFERYQCPDSDYIYDNEHNAKSLVFRKTNFHSYEKEPLPSTYLNVNGNTVHTTDFIYRVYSIDDNKLKYIVNTNHFTRIQLSDSEIEEYTSELIWHDGNRQLIRFTKAKCALNEEIRGYLVEAYTESLYLLELDSGKLAYLDDYTYYPHLSPDGKYLAYTDPGTVITDAQNDPADIMPEGIYVKNLEKGKTTFFPNLEDGSRNSSISWINMEKLINEISE